MIGLLPSKKQLRTLACPCRTTQRRRSRGVKSRCLGTVPYFFTTCFCWIY